MSNSTPEHPGFTLVPIGTVRQPEGDFCRLEILPPYRAGLKQLAHFSHVIALWWADHADNPSDRAVLTVEPDYAPGKLTGVFACRSPLRPNPIAITTTPILDVDEANGIVTVAYMDAIDGTPLVDLKAYFPTSDRPREVQIPDWLAHWPQWMPTEAWSPE